MPTDQNPKQLVAQRLKDATNILVTVGHNPGVDDLAAALALTLMLDKLGKTPTAVFSGKIPPAIEFLEPGKTFDTNVDSLRDFIIALDKEKADRLRYKVEGDVVRVFITPYKTTITEKDLTFSEGDFNVDLIVAFGVEKREDLDAAITAHGRILHDAAIITINQRPGGSSLGEIDWTDTEASSLSEMLMSLSESLQSGLLDQPIATALLTGLVSSTDRFRNEKTSPKVMTMAAQLMAAGANQQLIAEKLEAATTVTSSKLNGTGSQSADTEQAAEAPKKSSDGEMKVEHSDVLDAPMPSENSSEDAADRKAKEVASEESAEAVEEAEEELEKITDTQLPPVSSADDQRLQSKGGSWRDAPIPSTGGTLNATTEEAEEQSRMRDDDEKNRVILSHDSPRLGEQERQAAVLNSTGLPPTEPTVDDIFSELSGATEPAQSASSAPQPAVAGTSASATLLPNAQPSTKPTEEPVLSFEATPLPASVSGVATNPTIADLEEQVRHQEAAEGVPLPVADPVESARAAVDAALGTQPFNPAGQPLAASGAQPLGEVDHVSSVVPSEQPVDQPASPLLPDAPIVETLPPPALPPLPPLPDFSTLPPLPGAPVETPAPSTFPVFGLPDELQSSGAPVVPSSSTDPGQFKLPGQS